MLVVLSRGMDPPERGGESSHYLLMKVGTILPHESVWNQSNISIPLVYVLVLIIICLELPSAEDVHTPQTLSDDGLTQGVNLLCVFRQQ